MKKNSVEVTEKKEEDWLVVVPAAPVRDLNRVGIIARKKGAHRDIRREADKNACRKAVQYD